MDQFYTAIEAAEKLGLNYHTFMARVRLGKYSSQQFGRQLAFLKKEIDDAADSQCVETSTR
jgi:predicted ATPase